MRKKLTAAILAAVMSIALIACGSADPGSTGTQAPSESAEAAPAEAAPAEASAEESNPADWPVIKVEILSFTDAQEKEPEIEQALNEYLVSIDAGVQADLLPIAIGDRATTLTLMLADPDNPIDLFGWRFYSTVPDMVHNDQIISLEKYRDVYPDLWDLFPEDVYRTCQVNGEQYSIPGADSFGNFQVYAMRKDVAEEIGVADKASTRITLEELNDILLKAEEAHPELCWHGDTAVLPLQGIDNFGETAWLGVLLNRGVDSHEIINYYASPEFRAYCEQCKWWKDNGMIVDDPLNNTYAGYTLMNDGVGGGYLFEAYNCEYALSLMKAQIQYETIVFQLTDFAGNNSCVYNGWNISSVCRNPDAAMKLLYLMYTDPQVCRYFTLGIEGLTYKVDENGCAWYADGKDVNNVGWNLSAPWFYPNECLSLPFETDYAGYFSDMAALWSDDSLKYSEAMGFVFDKTPVFDQYSACAAIVDEYRTALLMGQVDIDDYLARFNDELSANGIDEIVAEMQKQFDEFEASKN